MAGQVCAPPEVGHNPFASVCNYIIIYVYIYIDVYNDMFLDLSYILCRFSRLIKGSPGGFGHCGGPAQGLCGFEQLSLLL